MAKRWIFGVPIALVLFAVVAIGYGRADLSRPWAHLFQQNETIPQAPEQIGPFADRLAAKLKEDSADRSGWITLARAYNADHRPLAAAAAYEKAIALPPPDAQLHAEYAFVVVNASGQRFSAKSEQLIRSALKIEPGNQNALGLAGSLEWSKGNTAGAIDAWERLHQQLPPNSTGARTVASALEQARAK